MGRSKKDRNKRAGDILGLGGPDSSVINRESEFPNTSSAGTDEARRRQRMSEGADEVTSGTGEIHRGSGATGIDMGSGGEGTDIE
jgi:hypothetical protein